MTNQDTTHPLLKRRRIASAMKYAVYTLDDAFDVAKAIHGKGGGVANNDELAAFLGYKSSNNGAYYDRTSAARMYGLIQGQGAQITLTKRAEQLIMPVYPEQVALAKVEAFLGVPLFRAVFEEFQGKQLPPDAGMKNLLRTKYGVPPSRVDLAYRALMESADQAGFFSTRGTRTQLIQPRVNQVVAPESIGEPAANDAAGDQDAVQSSAGRQTERQPTRSMGDLKGAYVSTLIDILREKGPDPELMAKIEKLLGLEDAKLWEARER